MFKKDGNALPSYLVPRCYNVDNSYAHIVK